MTEFQDELIGRVNLSNIVRGAWQNATLGSFLDRAHNGRGYMSDAVKLALTFAFTQAGLHRVQAGVMPRNKASIRVLEKTAFGWKDSLCAICKSTEYGKTT